MKYIDALENRYSVKKFDTDRPVPKQVLEKILNAGKLSPSSLGLQPYRIIVVESPEMKNKIIPAFGNPSQISTCSHLIVLVTKTNIDQNYLDGYFQHISDTRNIPIDHLSSFRSTIESYIESLPEDELFHWNEKQTYILLGNLMFAAALEDVDTCPMEGFSKEDAEKLLNINTEEEKATVTLALGYRSEEDRFKDFTKVRKPDNKLFKFL